MNFKKIILYVLTLGLLVRTRNLRRIGEEEEEENYFYIK